jgi:hypothetical protein
MRIATFFFIGVALAFLVSTPAVAQEETEAPSIDLTGQWEFQSESPRGTRTSRITFEQDGAKLEGYTEMRDQRVPLSGTVKGNEFEFTINMTMGDRSMQIKYTGTVDGDTAEGTIETMRGSNPFTARRLS